MDAALWLERELPCRLTWEFALWVTRCAADRTDWGQGADLGEELPW